MESTGFLHFITQSDSVGKALFVLLVGMSIVCWSLIILKFILFYRVKQQNNNFIQYLQRINSCHEVEKSLNKQFKGNMLARIAKETLEANAMYQTLTQEVRVQLGNAQDYLMGVMQQCIQQELSRISFGLTVLATIAATSPFIGLFGTVWGIYHALLAIGSSGMASLDQLATPVGEALIMTGLGLAVAIPAVVAYNWLLRKIKSLNVQLDAYTFEFLPLVLTGKFLHRSFTLNDQGNV